jgi:hypothetical protein
MSADHLALAHQMLPVRMGPSFRLARACHRGTRDDWDLGSAVRWAQVR